MIIFQTRLSIYAIADWLMDRLYSLKYSLQDFITG